MCSQCWKHWCMGILLELYFEMAADEIWLNIVSFRLFSTSPGRATTFFPSCLQEPSHPGKLSGMTDCLVPLDSTPEVTLGWVQGKALGMVQRPLQSVLIGCSHIYRHSSVHFPSSERTQTARTWWRLLVGILLVISLWTWTTASTLLDLWPARPPGQLGPCQPP